MKKLVAVSFFVMVLAIAGFGQKSAAGTSDPSKSVHDAFDRLVEGIKQVDVDKVMAAYEKSDRLLIFNNNGSATIGWDTVKTNNESTYAKLKNVSLEITGLRIEMLGRTAAVVTCKWKQTQENNGKLEDAAGRMTLIFKLIGKDWKITHRHTSPNRPDPGQPVFPSERITDLARS